MDARKLVDKVCFCGHKESLHVLVMESYIACNGCVTALAEVVDDTPLEVTYYKHEFKQEDNLKYLERLVRERDSAGC